MNSISIVRQGQVLCMVQGEEEVSLLYHGEYMPEDMILFEAGQKYVTVSVDQQVPPARIYLPERRFAYRLPLSGDNLAVYAPGAFKGERHLISMKPDDSFEYRNLAENPADQRGDSLAFPHATANVETRNESVFAARNVIDGIHIANGHGEWPYGSWGIGARTDACLTLDFGREVEIDAIGLYLRADFPHDAWWIRGSVTLSDGTEKTFDLQKKNGKQQIDLGRHRISWLKLDRLVKCDVESAFPALRQLEVYGQDIVEE